MEKFKPYKMIMKYDSLELKIGDIVEINCDADYRHYSGRGAHFFDGSYETEKKAEKKIEEVEITADLKPKEEEEVVEEVQELEDNKETKVTKKKKVSKKNSKQAE